MTKATFSLSSALLLGISFSATRASERKVQGAPADQAEATLRESAAEAADGAGLLEQETLKDYLKYARAQDEEQHLKQVLEGGGQ